MDHQRASRWVWPGLAGLLLLVLGAIVSSCGGGAAAQPGPTSGTPLASADPRLLPLGTPLPALPAQDGSAGKASSSSGQGQQLDYPGAVFLNAAGGTVDGDTLVLQSSADQPAWAMYKADGLSGLKVNTFAVETIPGDLNTQYSVGLSNFSDGTWKYFITSSLPEVDVDLSHNTRRLVSRLGNLYWIVVVSGGQSVRVVAGHVLIGAEHDGDWCPQQVTGLTVSQGLADHIHISWDAADHVRKYELWGRMSPDKSARGASCWNIGHGNDWVKVAETSDTSFDDMDAQASVWYDYKVRADNHCGAAGFSAPASGYEGDKPGGGGTGGGGDVDSTGVITALDDTSLALDNGAAFGLTADTQWFLTDGGAGLPSGFAVGDTVAVHGQAGADGMATALTVTMVQIGGDPVLFDAESIIVTRDGGALSLQNGMNFTYDASTQWLDADGNPASIDLFVTDTAVHVWGSILGQGPAKALKVQLEPVNPV